MSTEPVLTQHKVMVLLIDDQPMIGEAVRRMLAGEPDIDFHYNRDAAKALDEADRVKPTVILQDLVMPEIDGLTLVKKFRAHEPTRETPLIVLSTKEEPAVKAEAFALGANDYIVKLPDRLELLARIRYHSKGYITLLQRNEAYDALLESQHRLANEMKQAAHYVQSLLPDKLKKGDITDRLAVRSLGRAGRRFVRLPLARRRPFRLLPAGCQRPRSRLGLALGLGHERPAVAGPAPDRFPRTGPGARRPQQRLPDGPAERPLLHHLVRRLSQADAADRLLRRRPSAGPALERPSADQAALEILESSGPMIGAVPDLEFETASTTLGAFAKLYIYSDGVYEIERIDKTMWPFNEFIEFMKKGPHDADERLQDGSPDRVRPRDPGPGRVR